MAELEPPKAASGLKAALTRKVGPLPIWAYGAIVAAGVLALKLFTNKSASSSAGAFTTTSASPAENLLPSPTTPSADNPTIPAPGEPPTATAAAPAAPPLAIPARTAPSYVGKTAAVLALEPAGGWKAPPIFQQISPSAVLDTSLAGQSGTVNPKNVLIGFVDAATGTLFTQPGPGRQAVWK